MICKATESHSVYVYYHRVSEKPYFGEGVYQNMMNTSNNEAGKGVGGNAMMCFK